MYTISFTLLIFVKLYIPKNIAKQTIGYTMQRFIVKMVYMYQFVYLFITNFIVKVDYQRQVLISQMLFLFCRDA